MYAKLAELGCKATKPGGLVVLCSCSAAVDLFALTRALATEATILGVNARDLRSFDVDSGRAGELVERIPASRVAVFMSGAPADARRLLDQKTEMRAAELLAAERHLERLREGRPETLETTSLHLDVLRDLRRIHSHIVSVAYPVLEAAGELPKIAADNGPALGVPAADQPLR